MCKNKCTENVVLWRIAPGGDIMNLNQLYYFKTLIFDRLSVGAYAYIAVNHFVRTFPC